MIRAGHERARRNLHDTWALRRSQPLVTLGLSGLVLTVGAAGPARSIRRRPPISAGTARLSTARPQAAPAGRSAGGPSGRRIEGGDLAAEAGQDQPAADEVGADDDLGVGEPPGHGPVRFDRERLDLGLDEDVRQPRRRQQRDDRLAERWSQRASPVARLEAVGVEAVGDDQEPFAVPVQRARVVVDERREPGRPGAARSFDPELRPAQGSGSDETRGPRSMSEPPASVRAKTAGPEPLPPQRQRARRPPG